MTHRLLPLLAACLAAATATQEPFTVLRWHADGVLALAFSPDGRTLVSGDVDGLAMLWHVRPARERRVLRGHEGAVSQVAYRADGKVLATAGWDGTVRLWDAATGKALRTLRGHASTLPALALSPDGKLVASPDTDGRFLLRDARTGAALLDRTDDSDATSAWPSPPTARAWPRAADGVARPCGTWPRARCG
jgi:WD40 repeat protein